MWGTWTLGPVPQFSPRGALKRATAPEVAIGRVAPPNAAGESAAAGAGPPGRTTEALSRSSQTERFDADRTGFESTDPESHRAFALAAIGAPIVESAAIRVVVIGGILPETRAEGEQRWMIQGWPRLEQSINDCFEQT
jgi:hypothetical protein